MSQLRKSSRPPASLKDPRPPLLNGATCVVNLSLGHVARCRRVLIPHGGHNVAMHSVCWRIMRRATAGLVPILVLVGVAAVSAGQNPPARADVQNEATWAFLRTRNARDYAIATPNGIDDARYVEVGGIQQWITIRGEDRNNPVLLFLHGGPGAATNPWGYAGFRLWLKHFTVVQWDQRGAGRTFGKNRDAPTQDITIARMTQDGVELADLLRKQLRKDKIILVGHSWGSTLGVHMVKARPDLFYAFVGTGQVADAA